MSEAEIILWIALPSLIGLAALAMVWLAVKLRRHFPPVKKD